MSKPTFIGAALSVCVIALALCSSELLAADKPTGERKAFMHAGAGQWHGEFDADRVIGQLDRWLQLDAVQEQKLRNLAAAAEPELTALSLRAKANRRAIRALSGLAPDFGTELQTLAMENGQIATELTLLTGQLRADLHAALTTEQREQLAAGRKRQRDHARRSAMPLEEPADSSPSQ